MDIYAHARFVHDVFDCAPSAEAVAGYRQLAAALPPVACELAYASLADYRLRPP